MRLWPQLDQVIVRSKLRLQHLCRITPHGKPATPFGAALSEGRDDDEAAGPDALIKRARVGRPVGLLDEEVEYGSVMPDRESVLQRLPGGNVLRDP